MVGCNRKDFDWAVSVLHSRCFIQGPQSIHMTVPGVDMANHSFSPNATVRCTLCLAACCSIKHSHENPSAYVPCHWLCCWDVWQRPALCHAVPSHCPTLPFMCCLPALPCPSHVTASAALPWPALHMACRRCLAVPCPALCDGLVTF